MSAAELFDGPVKRKILEELEAAGERPVYARDLCRAVFGDVEKRNRDTLRNLVSQMRPKLEQHGFAIDGRDQLRMHAYRLRVAVL